MYMEPGINITCLQWCCSVRFGSTESGTIADAAAPNLTLKHRCRHFHLHTGPHNHLIHTFSMHWMYIWPGVHVCNWAMLDSAVSNLTLKHHWTHFHLNTRPHNHLIHTLNVHWMFVWPSMQVVCKCVQMGISDSATLNLTFSFTKAFLHAFQALVLPNLLRHQIQWCQISKLYISPRPNCTHTMVMGNLS
jgi:hypothetical protein